MYADKMHSITLVKRMKKTNKKKNMVGHGLKTAFFFILGKLRGFGNARFSSESRVFGKKERLTSKKPK